MCLIGYSKRFVEGSIVKCWLHHKGTLAPSSPPPLLPASVHRLSPGWQRTDVDKEFRAAGEANHGRAAGWDVKP